MPDPETLERARKDAAQGKSPSTQAGEFVREEMHHVREGKHGVRSTKQAIAIGLSKARKAGVDLHPPKAGTVSEKTRAQAARAYEAGGEPRSKPPSRVRSRAVSGALKQEPHRGVVSKAALAKQAREAAANRSPRARSPQAKRAAQTRRRTRP